MTPQLAALVAEMEAVKARIEAMKAENKDREQRGLSIAYTESSFFDEADSLMKIAEIMRQL